MDALQESGMLENLPVRDDGTLDLTELAPAQHLIGTENEACG